MKKLIIAAAIVCAAAFAQASSVTWGLSADVYTGGDDTVGTAWVIALSSNDLTGLGIDTDGNVVLGTGMSVVEGTEMEVDGTMTSSITKVNDSGYYALIIGDNTTHQWNAAAQYVEVVPNNDKDQVTADFADTWGDEVTLSNDPVTVPEPTSGLLLLLGVAGLALRRRRA